MNGEQCGVLMRMRERMNWNGVLRDETRNGNDETNIPAEKYMQIILLPVFFFLHNCWVVGNFCGLSGSGAGLRVGLVRLFYIIWL